MGQVTVHVLHVVLCEVCLELNEKVSGGMGGKKEKPPSLNPEVHEQGLLC